VSGLRSASRVTVCLLLVAIATLGLAPPAHAAPQSQIYCSLAAQVTFSPGLSMTPAAQSFSGSGPIACARKPASALTGTISFTGTTSPQDACATGAGSGTFSARLAGTASLTLTGRFTFLREGPVVDGPVTLTDDDSGFGNLHTVLVPTPGQTCLSTPVTSGVLTGALNAKGTIQ